MVEEYNEYGEIIQQSKSRLSNDQEHRIHQTKDLFVGDCSLCQVAIKNKVESYWGDDQ